MDNITAAAHILTDAGIDIPGSSVSIHSLAYVLREINRHTSDMLEALETEYEKYMTNMRILLQEAERKLRALCNPATRLREIMEVTEPDVRDALQNLRNFVGGRPEIEHDPEDTAYLPEIFRFWRRFGGRPEASPYEELWQWVAGRPLTWEQ